jgi:hypothetical protein
MPGKDRKNMGVLDLMSKKCLGGGGGEELRLSELQLRLVGLDFAGDEAAEPRPRCISLLFRVGVRAMKRREDEAIPKMIWRSDSILLLDGRNEPRDT